MLSNLSVLTGNKVTDLSLPADAPIQEWIDRVVAVLGEQFEGQEVVGFNFQQETVWTLAPVGKPPVRRQSTLNEAEIVDGDLVVVQPVSSTERHRGRYEDVVDVVAIMHSEPRFDRAALVSWLSWWTALTLVLVAFGGIYGYTAAGARGWWWAGALIAGGVGCAVLSGQISRRGHERIAAAVAVGALANIVVGAALVVPLPERYGWLGAPQVAGASFALFICSIVLSWKGPHRWRAWTSFLAASSVLGLLGALVVSYGGKSWMWAVLAAAGLWLLKATPRLVPRVARIALPPIPTPGMEVDLDELLDPVVDIKAEAGEADQQTWAKILASVPQSSARLAERAELCQQLLAGFMGAGAAGLAVGIVLGLQQGHFLPHTVVLAALAIGVLLFRYRLPEDRRCKWSLLSAAAAIGVGSAVKMALWWPTWSPLIVVVVVVSLAVILAAVAASPFGLNAIQQRLLEGVDTVMVGLMFPGLAWAAGAYDFLRNLSIPGAN